MSENRMIQFGSPHSSTKNVWDIVYFPLGAAAFGGAERSLLDLAAAQQAKGLRVLVCYEVALESGDFTIQASNRGLPLLRVDWTPEKSLIEVFRAAWIFFRKIDTRVVHFNMSWRRHMWIIPMMARLRCNALLIGTIRAMPDDYELIPRRLYLGFIPGLRLWMLPDLAMGRVWAKTLHLAVSVNRDDYPPRLIREFNFSPERLKVIYNGVIIPSTMPSINEHEAAKESLGYDANVFLAAYIGRVSEEKGIRYAIDAIASCDPRVHLVIAGEGEETEVLQAYVERLGLTARIRFIGYVSDPLPIFSAAEVTLVPSLWNEAFGRVVVEAMACGSAVIATAVGGMQELFTNGKEGIYVPKADAQAIATAINNLCANPHQQQDMARAGRQLVESRYAMKRVVADYSELYSSTLGHNRNAASPQSEGEQLQ
jgi:glycosyltransferase involved in cell wall biosynthesis